jgi:predicted ATPase
LFVTGEPGIGKTTLVDEFVSRVQVSRDVWIARGQCLQHFGPDEPYMPVLEALTGLCRRHGAACDLLRHHAPAWLAEMPGLTAADDRVLLSRELRGASRQAMLRQVAEALDAITRESPLLLVLEDLQWCDYSTVDVLSALGRRREPARLLVVGTYRPAEAIHANHPVILVKQDLQLRGVEELAMQCLTEPDVECYVRRRLADGSSAVTLASAIHGRTEGHPLFVVRLTDHVLGRTGRAAPAADSDAGRQRPEAQIPGTIRLMIERELANLSPAEYQTLEAASIAGVEFFAGPVAAALEEDATVVESRCEGLIKRRHLIERAHAVDVKVDVSSSSYRFLHALYRDVLYEGIGPGRRAELHRRIGAHLEATLGDRAVARAAELAMHFDRGRDCLRAITYLRRAARQAAVRFANHEVIALTRHGLELAPALPDRADRARHEATLLAMQATARMAATSFADPEIETLYRRAAERFARAEDPSQRSGALLGLWGYYVNRGDIDHAEQIASELGHVAEGAEDPRTRAEASSRAHWARAATLVSRGAFPVALHEAERMPTADDCEREGFAGAPQRASSSHRRLVLRGVGTLATRISRQGA